MEVVEWLGTNDMDYATNGSGVSLKDLNSNEKVTDSQIYGNDDTDFIALTDSDRSW